MTPRLESVKHLAMEAFKDHVLKPKVTEGEVRAWLVQQPGAGIYHFWVTLLPRTIIISGDIGDAIMNVSSLDPLHWIRAVCGPHPDRETDYSYVASKIRTGEQRTFDYRLAERFLATFVDESGEDSPAERAVLQERVDRIRAASRMDYESGSSFYQACYEEGIELEGAAADYPADRYWTVECLRTFARLLP